MDKLNGQEKFEIIAMASFPIQVAIYFAIFKIIQKCKRNKMKKEYTFKVTAKCIGKEEQVHKSMDDKASLNGMRTSLAILKFEYNGKEYIVDNGFSSTNQPYAPGDDVEILINPSDPSKSYILSDEELPRYYAKARKNMDKMPVILVIAFMIPFYAFLLYWMITQFLND